ncbi:MAG: peptide chain release factor N(5)-glutamine methyltransferase [Litorimonas sp.]
MKPPVEKHAHPVGLPNTLSGLTPREAKRVLVQQFNAANLPFAEDDAQELLMAATGLDPLAIMLNNVDCLLPHASEILSGYAQRRLSGEPVDHILGWREFYGRRFKINKDVLSPRADTETLIPHALSALKNIDAPHILDLGTGSGALLITLLAENNDAVGIGIDISQSALSTAQCNAHALGVESRAQWVCGDWFTPLKPEMRFDAIISNPPYINEIAMQALAPEVKDYDPHIALHGGEDGLVAYRHILRAAAHWLKPGGWIGLEIGFDQKTAVTALLGAANFTSIDSYKDLSGNNRALCAITKS